MLVDESHLNGLNRIFRDLIHWWGCVMTRRYPVALLGVRGFSLTILVLPLLRDVVRLEVAWHAILIAFRVFRNRLHIC